MIKCNLDQFEDDVPLGSVTTETRGGAGRYLEYLGWKFRPFIANEDADAEASR